MSRYLSPVLPGAVGIIGGIAEVALITKSGTMVAENVPLWIQAIPLAGVVLVGWWAINRLLAHESKTAERDLKVADALTALEKRLSADDIANVKALEQRDDEKHRANIERFEAIEHMLSPIVYAVIGSHGEGGLMEKEKRNRILRHDLPNEMLALVTRVQLLELWAVRCGEKIPGAEFDPVPEIVRQRRRGTDDHDS